MEYIAKYNIWHLISFILHCAYLHIIFAYKRMYINNSRIKKNLYVSVRLFLTAQVLKLFFCEILSFRIFRNLSSVILSGSYQNSSSENTKTENFAKKSSRTRALRNGLIRIPVHILNWKCSIHTEMHLTISF
jgi:hypothetical protein